ncbi:hypothetical protein [Tardiphaga sp.]|uniref:hypothetical protein n=1 Tax=Tardiphaga sp. TaxID=1926292 RepID=UPI00352B6FFD
MITIEPPSCSSSLIFIGKNRRGQWVAQEQNGLFGGLFVSRANAVRYALFENGHHPETIIETAGLIELDMSAVPVTAATSVGLLQQRRVA